MLQSYSEVIVVNYGCTQNTSEWLRTFYPSVKIVEVDDDPIFSLSRARNIGTQKAVGDFLLFTDADVFVRHDLGRWIYENAKDNEFYIVPRDADASLCGTVVCSKSNFNMVGGYDEAFRGWGWEDLDLYIRFSLNKVQEKNLSSQYFLAIEHSDSERQLPEELGGGGNRATAMMIGRIYTYLKKDIYKNIGREPDLKIRKELMHGVRTAVFKMLSSESSDNQLMEVQLGNFLNEYDVSCKVKLIYELYKEHPI